jgi:hypothetical protein
MKQRSKVIVGGAIILGIAAFTFLAPAFYWFKEYSPAEFPPFNDEPNPPPIFTAYRSLGCEFLGFGDEYFTAGVTIAPVGQPTYGATAKGVVFSCATPDIPQGP